MSNLQSLTRLQFEIPPKPSRQLGSQGNLQWIEIGRLRIDPTYQRPVDTAGKRNIRRIVENFQWSKFSPLIVSPRKGGVYAIIDGQHRAIAAETHGGIKKLPCFVLECSPEEEASAFATINGLVTRMQTQYLFRARLAAGDGSAAAAVKACTAAGAKIMPYPVPASLLKPGETLAAKTIEWAVDRYGHDTVVAALELVTRTGDGNPGLLKEFVITAFADVMGAHPIWLKRKFEARKAVEAISLKAMIVDAMRLNVERGGGARAHLAAQLEAMLERALGEGGKPAEPVPTPAMIARTQARRSHKKDFAITPPKSKLSTTDRAAVEKFIAEKGIRKFDTADTGQPWAVLEYLQRKGYKIESTSKFQYLYKGKRIDFARLLQLANAERAKEGKEPITARKAV